MSWNLTGFPNAVFLLLSESIAEASQRFCDVEGSRKLPACGHDRSRVLKSIVGPTSLLSPHRTQVVPPSFLCKRRFHKSFQMRFAVPPPLATPSSFHP